MICGERKKICGERKMICGERKKFFTKIFVGFFRGGKAFFLRRVVGADGDMAGDKQMFHVKHSAYAYMQEIYTFAVLRREKVDCRRVFIYNWNDIQKSRLSAHGAGDRVRLKEWVRVRDQEAWLLRMRPDGRSG